MNTYWENVFILRAVWNETFGFQPEGLRQHSPGQRPGKTIKQPYAPCRCATACLLSQPFRLDCQISMRPRALPWAMLSQPFRLKTKRLIRKYQHISFHPPYSMPGTIFITLPDIEVMSTQAAENHIARYNPGNHPFLCGTPNFLIVPA